MKKISLNCVILVLLLSGCISDNTSSEDARSRQIEMYTKVLSDYMKDQNTPALQSVEQWENDYGAGLKLTTAHYEILTTLLEPQMLCKMPQFMESAYSAYNSQLPNAIETPTKSTIYLFANRRQWEHFTWIFAGQYAETFYKIQAGAYYHNGACVAYNIGDDKTFFALGHEGWHQFNSRIFKYRLPSWLDEGVAMLFESSLTNNGQMYFDPSKNSYRLDALKKTLTNGKLIPLEELTAINPGQVLATNDAEPVMAFYSQSYALIRFLREANNGQRFEIYQQLLADGLQGKWPLDQTSREVAIDRNMPRTILWNHIVGSLLFRNYISSDYEQIEKEYIEFCRQIVR